MSSIKLKHSGGNGVIISAPDTNPASDKTIKLPSTESGVFATKDSANSLQNVTGVNGGQLSNRNIVINGGMEVDQRNGGSAVTSSPGNTLNFAADRYHVYNYNCGELTATLQRVADAPAGFYNSNKVTITTPESSGGTPAADDRFSMQHRIEGRNINRLSLGTSGAKDFVISFYVKASIAGNYGLAVINNSGSRSYCMLYAATTSWSRVVLKVPGDTSGTYQAGTSSGLELKFGLYNGSNRAGADQGIAGTGSWSSSNAPQGTIGQTQLGATNGATWQITGLQVEAGTEVTEFEHRSFGQELAFCQRYFYKWVSSVAYSNFSIGYATSATNVETIFQLPVIMRASPSLSTTNTFRLVAYNSSGQSVSTLSSIQITRSHPRSLYIRATASGMTTGQIGEWGDNGSNNATFSFSAEL